jgi:hypothetical protein
MTSGKWVGARIADTENSFCVGWIPDDLDEGTRELIRVDSKRDAQVLATVLNSFDGEPITGQMSGMPAAIPANATVHVVEVFDRTDGVYVFAEHDDAVAFEDAVNGDHDTSLGSLCSRHEEVVCDHELALKLIEAEREDS